MALGFRSHRSHRPSAPWPWTAVDGRGPDITSAVLPTDWSPTRTTWQRPRWLDALHVTPEDMKKHIKTCYSTLSTSYIHVESHMLSKYKEMMYIQLMKKWCTYSSWKIGPSVGPPWESGSTLCWDSHFEFGNRHLRRGPPTQWPFFGAQLVMGEMVAWNSW